jgi:hypothetical protein
LRSKKEATMLEKPQYLLFDDEFLPAILPGESGLGVLAALGGGAIVAQPDLRTLLRDLHILGDKFPA